MKKNYSLLKYFTALFFSLGFCVMANASNELVIENADNVTGRDWTWTWNGAAAKVANPLQSSINNSTNVWKFTPTQMWGGFATGDDAGLGIDFSKYSKFQCLVYCPTATKAIKLFIEVEGAGAGVDLGLIDCKNGWAIAEGSVAGWTNTGNKFAIKNGDNTEAGMEIYFDDIKFIDPSGASFIMLDNAETYSLAWDWSWGGMTHSVAANPLKDAVNGSDYVREMKATAEWAGLSQGYNGTTVAQEFDFSVFSEFQMLVYCPGVPSLQLIVGIEDADDGANFEINQACASGWVKVIGDVSSWVGNSSNKFFIKNGSGTTNTPIYIDNVAFVKPGSSTGIDTNSASDTGCDILCYGNNIKINTSAENFSYIVYDMVGAVVLQGKSAISSANLDIQHLPKGVYVVKVVIGGKQLAQKIIF